MITQKNVAFFASGEGTTFRAFLEQWKQGILPIQPVILVTNNSTCGAVTIAHEYGVEVFHISSKSHPNEQEFASEMLQKLQDAKIELILLVGYMKKLPANVIEHFKGCIYNTHPALLPKYGGKGMYGINVHKAVLQNNETESGATIHLVTEEYDEGQIIAQTVVPVVPNDTPEILQERVKLAERKLYIETIRALVFDSN